MRPALAAAPLLCLLVAGCPGSDPVPDAGHEPVDASTPVSCQAPPDCRVAGVDGVCRQNVCRADVKCADDVECGLGESCVDGRCRFTGCLSDDDCVVGTCRTDVFACTECKSHDECPASEPVCTLEGRCVRCQSDADCSYPGPAYCEVASGTCRHCLQNSHCPTGLTCNGDGVCVGAGKGQACIPASGSSPAAILCSEGLMCVTPGQQNICLEACNLYTPSCPTGEICVKLTFSDSPSLVFEQGAPFGVCYTPFQGARGYHETCNDNCQPNLACIPDSPTQRTCKAYCDPKNPFCGPNEICHPFPGDYWGHEYGLCYPDNGYGEPCTADGDCRAGQACVPRDDPSRSPALSNACAFKVGDNPGMAPCSTHAECMSGSCRADPVLGTGAPYFCFAACQEDADCNIGGRTGECDADFPFTTPYIPAPGAPVRGCRPGCSAPGDCAGYGAGHTCRAQLDLKELEVDRTCAPVVGEKLLGEACASDAECRDGLCLRRDGRGVARSGVCAHPCAGATDCVPPPLSDGGTAASATACVASALLVSNGGDGLPNTVDDRHGPVMLCQGDACTRNGDCAAPYSVCTVDVLAGNPLGALVTVCRAPSVSGTLQAGDACTADAECVSGVCATRADGTSRTCLQPCDPATPDCPGGTTCTASGARVRTANGTDQFFDACLP